MPWNGPRVGDALLGEHGMLHIVCREIEKFIPEAKDVLEIRAYARLLAAALREHNLSEDTFLLRPLEPSIAGLGPIEGMRMDYHSLTSVMDRVQSTGDVATAADLLRMAVSLARRHFEREEQLLFRLSDAILEDEEQQRLGRMWGESRGIGRRRPGTNTGLTRDPLAET